ncbi:MAG: SufE family protein [Bryobacterales bacterium]|nr:SufE family protein [Bryobacterales bacterium]
MKDRSIREVHEEIVEEFEFLDDWMDRYQHIIDLGRQLPAFPKEFQTDEHRVRGCQAQVWMHSECLNGRLHLKATSDAAIVSGLIAVLLRAYSGFPAEEVLAAGHRFIDRIGFTQHLSPTRGNGLYAMVRTIRQHAVRACHTRHGPG